MQSKSKMSDFTILNKLGKVLQIFYSLSQIDQRIVSALDFFDRFGLFILPLSMIATIVTLLHRFAYFCTHFRIGSLL